MVVLRRASSILIAALFYCALGSACFYLVWGASQGDRGLTAKANYESQTAELRQELDALHEERERWTRRVDALRSELIDRDLLEEEAHSRLDRAYKDEVVIFFTASAARPNP